MLVFRCISLCGFALSMLVLIVDKLSAGVLVAAWCGDFSVPAVLRFVEMFHRPPRHVVLLQCEFNVPTVLIRRDCRANQAVLSGCL